MTGTITKPVLEEYIIVTRRNYISENEWGKIVEKSFLEIKGKFLEKLTHDAFSGTNGEDTVEHIVKFLNLVEPINIQNISSNWLRLSIFPVSFTGAASEWFREECIGSVTTWDQNNNEFEKWLASNFKNYMMMDHITMNALWKFWKKNNDQKGTTSGRIDDRIEDSENENEVTEIFRIETEVFDYESPMCKAFDEFNYLLKINPDVLTNDIPGFKTYEQFKKWPTCSWKENGRCNKGNFPGQYLIGNQIHYQDYEWYEALIDYKLKDKALRNKAELKKSMNHEGELSDDAWRNYSPINEWSDHEEGDNTEPDVNYNPYLDIAQLFNCHTNKEEGGDDQGKNENTMTTWFEGMRN
ncbi:hypothetical protein Tco_0569819 [Tanacetum coccineum]